MLREATNTISNVNNKQILPKSVELMVQFAFENYFASHRIPQISRFREKSNSNQNARLGKHYNII